MFKTNNLSDVIAFIIMAIIYCSVAFYFISIGTSTNQVIFTIVSFVLGAFVYLKMSFKRAKTNEAK